MLKSLRTASTIVFAAAALSSVCVTSHVHAQSVFNEIKLGNPPNTMTLQASSTGGPTTFQFPSGSSTVLTNGNGQSINGALTLGSAPTTPGQLSLYNNNGDSATLSYSSVLDLSINTSVKFTHPSPILSGPTGDQVTPGVLTIAGGDVSGTSANTAGGAIRLLGGIGVGSGGRGAVSLQNSPQGGSVQIGTSTNNATVTVGGGTSFKGILSATATLDFGTVGQQSQKDLTINVSGAGTNDAVILGLPNSPDGGCVYNAFVSGAGVVTVRCSNIATSTVTSAQTFRVTVIKY